ncbi:hypothetical protein [Flagellimonas algicola]|uniref:Uncharacterized protein n=1 Tax=Flagellimonas algicola TaxID=2583815 RepID=A0ABY2WH20_9FLAO|nr:hypothetical protein [Allomuricauda algicola]TMU50883.1 hypothetical protein FGG15_16795 [Allomuricauda algicola]
MLQQLHLATQYLATAGISFLEKKADDSHTNLGFSMEKARLETWPLDSTGTQLCLNYRKFALEWTSEEELSLALNGKTHEEVVAWLKKTAEQLGLPSYRFDLHYSLPYSMDENFKFEFSNADQVAHLIQSRTLVQQALASFLEKEDLGSEIRIWPHHFDTGAFTALNDGSGKSIGLGMAIPDTLVDDLYLYISGYRGHDALRTWAFKSLTRGKWVNDAFKGAVLPLSGLTKDIAVQFFQEALARYKNLE